MRRQPGEAIIRREVWRGEPKVGWAGIVVEDSPSLLALYIPEGSPLAFADEFFGGPHPGRTVIAGSGTVSSSSNDLGRCTRCGFSGTARRASYVAGT